jgi:hypothetical protein
MVSDFMVDEGPWQPSSLCMPLIKAGVRLYTAKHAIEKIQTTVEQLAADAHRGARNSVDAMRKDPEWAAEAGTTEEGLAEEVAWISHELPLMLWGQIPVYLFSVLETALSECLAVAAAKRGLPDPHTPRGAKLEGYLNSLKDACGVEVEWGDEIKSRLQTWRRRRNSMVHSLDFSLDADSRGDQFALEPYWGVGEAPDITQIRDLLDLIEIAVAAIDQAMCRANF